MGIDMKCIVEVLNKKTGNWECFGHSRAIRDRRLFSRIAGACNDDYDMTYVEPIDEPRFWPYDVSDKAKACDDDGRLNFWHTWLSRAELEALI